MVTHPLKAMALVVAALGHELLRAAHLDDGVPERGWAGGGRSVEANLVDAGRSLRIRSRCNKSP